MADAFRDLKNKHINNGGNLQDTLDRLTDTTADEVLETVNQLLVVLGVALADDKAVPEVVRIAAYDTLNELSTNVIAALIGTQQLLMKRLPTDPATFMVQQTVEAVDAMVHKEVVPDGIERLLNRYLYEFNL